MNVGTHLTNTAWEKQIRISKADFRQHVYVIGSTGSGKTNLLKYFMSQNSAFTLIDKEGDLAREIADAMPCIYWRARDYAFPVGLNPLLNVEPDERSRVAADVMELFSDIWGLGEQTPRLLYYLRASVRLLLDAPGTTLLDLRRVLSDHAYRARMLRKCT
jgi:type IV secretory pathway VirB4 component